MVDIEGDNLASSFPSCTLSKSDYSDVVAELCNNFVKKDIQKMKFLCSEFIKDKNFLERENLSAWDIFTEMNRNGSLSRENIGLLSQLINLIGKLKLQTNILTPKGVSPWKPGMKSYIDNFRLLLFNFSQQLRKEDVKKMLRVCKLRTFLTNAEAEDVAENPLRLFTVLIQKEVISDKNLASLKILVDEIDSDSMKKMLSRYEENSEKSKQLLTNNRAVGELMRTVISTLKSIEISDPTNGSLSSSGVSEKGDDLYVEEMSGPTPTLLRPADLTMAPKTNKSTDPPLSRNLDVHPGNPTTAKYNEAKSSPEEPSAHNVTPGVSAMNMTVRTEHIQKQIEDIKLSSKANEEPQKESLDEEKPSSAQKFDSTQSAFGFKSFATSLSESEEEHSVGTSKSEPSISLPTAKLAVGAMNMTVRTENMDNQIKDIKLSSKDNEDSIGDSSILHSVRMPVQRQDSDDRYSMTQIPRGYFLILTYDNFSSKEHKERKGNDKDRENLKKLCRELKFEECEAHNYTYKETEELVAQMSKKQHRDCFICFVCSHGDGKNFITSDGKKYSIKDLISSFTPENCKSLVGKPKIFFINSCLREKEVMYQNFTEVANSDKEIAADGPESIGLTAKGSSLHAEHADFCICLSTVPGFSSARQPELGTIYVQSVFKAFMKYYQTEHLSDILTHANKTSNDKLKERAEKNMKAGDVSSTRKICQVHPTITSLIKKLYF